MKLIAEKNLNKFAYPVFPIKGRPITHPYTTSFGHNTFRCTNGYMKPHNWMLMDVLGTCAYHYSYTRNNQLLDFGNKILTMSNSAVKNNSHWGLNRDILKTLLCSAQTSYDGIIDPAYYNSIPTILYRHNADHTMLRPLPTLKFEEGVVKKHMPFLKKYSSKQLHDIILETADCKLGMRYPVRYYDGDSYVNIDFGNYNCPSSFFSVVGVNNTKVSTDGKVLERSYQIRFDSYLGYIFVQNTVCSLYTDLLPDKFYNLTDSAQLLYRLLILPYYNNVKNPIRLEEIRQRLGWKTADISMVRNTIKRTLDELEAETFIRNPKEITTYGPYMYSYEKTPWKEIEK